MRLTAIISSFFLALAALVAFASPAQAGEAYVDSLSCNFSVAEQGDTVEVSGDGFSPGSSITVSITDEALPSYTLGAASVDVRAAFAQVLLVTSAAGDGSFVATVTIPAATPDGDYNILADGLGQDGNPRALACPVEVDAGIITPLAVTGSESKPLIQIGLAAIAVGALLVFFARSRMRRTEPVAAA
ncbi:MAG: hypothetical protein OEU32_01950 [Acidimicrobiia bacterium]|nr:hypothetical protein [Acidimicrobiia bacterium]